MLDLAINLGHGFFAAHGENGVAEANENADESDRSGQRRMPQPAERASMRSRQVSNIPQLRPGWKMRTLHQERVATPRDHHDYHHGGHVHDAQSLLARFGYALDVLSPKVNSHEHRKKRRPPVHRNCDIRVNVVQKL